MNINTHLSLLFHVSFFSLKNVRQKNNAFTSLMTVCKYCVYQEFAITLIRHNLSDAACKKRSYTYHSNRQ